MKASCGGIKFDDEYFTMNDGVVSLVNSGGAIPIFQSLI